MNIIASFGLEVINSTDFSNGIFFHWVKASFKSDKNFLSAKVFLPSQPRVVATALTKSTVEYSYTSYSSLAISLHNSTKVDFPEQGYPFTIITVRSIL